MKRLFLFTLVSLWFVGIPLTGKDTIPYIYVDGKGVMRWSDSHEEASFFGVNYTLPFAHAYRALGYVGTDRKAAIDKDVYHLARLGMNAYRIHLWDVELTDAQGNLIENEHLDLMDYLISQLKKRGIHVVITAQTDFGNGYPERDQPTGGFSYLYDKCEIHSRPEAIAAQERYLSALVQHVNPYTGQAYKDDPFIVGFEINNEPCHSGTPKEVKSYIDRMLAALHRAGNRKPVFYNVSHNGYAVNAFYKTAIQGTTYQWYPIGLVSGHTQYGNFLPAVDRYDIPFADQVKHFDSKARLVYEFDPADILYSYMYPAMARSFRSAGFQWMTQFAYDPLDIAYANTEYQTHYLNLAYTPHKAISLKIAAEAARSLKRGADNGSYPQDTLFGKGFRVSYIEDLSELNDGLKFYYSNTTHTPPCQPSTLISVAGCGSSPLVQYEGTGAYFIDRLESGVWRLEVMPDAIVVNDPFAKPSLKKEVVRILYGDWDMTLHLPDLGESFTIKAINEGNARLKEEEVTNGNIRHLRPGTYLLERKGCIPKQAWQADSRWGNICIGEFVAPVPRKADYQVAHVPAITAEAGRPLTIRAAVAGNSFPDSVIIYTDKVSFWNKHNPYFKMERTDNYTYQAVIPASELKEGQFRYNIVVCWGDSTRTYPAEDSDSGNAYGTIGNPLDWDYLSHAHWSTEIVLPDSPIRLLSSTTPSEPIETYRMEDRQEDFFRIYIKDIVCKREEKMRQCNTLCIRWDTRQPLPSQLYAGFITSDGYTYRSLCPAPSTEGIIRLPLDELELTDTALLPAAYPSFQASYFHPQTEIPFSREKIEKLELSAANDAAGNVSFRPKEIWLE